MSCQSTPASNCPIKSIGTSRENHLITPIAVCWSGECGCHS
ncbi:unnamed protein product, partial [Staurois parvus]